MNKKKLEKRELNKKFKEWAEQVKSRDGKKCVICGDSKRLNAHHIIPRSNKDLRFEIKNGISICPLHHLFSREISAHMNSLAFIIWLQENRKEQFEFLHNYCTAIYKELKK